MLRTGRSLKATFLPGGACLRGAYQPVHADAQVADADAGGVVEGVGNGGVGASDADLADSVGLRGADVAVGLLDEVDVDAADVGADGDAVLGQVVVDVVAVLLVEDPASGSAIDRPQVMPPMYWERARLGFMILPAAKTPGILGTRTSRLSVSMSTSAN